MKYEDILKKINGCGKYQKIVIFLLVLSSIPDGFFSMVTVFILDTPEHHCKINDLGFSVNSSMPKEKLLNSYIPMELDEEGNLVRSRCKEFANLLNGTHGNRTTVGCDSGWTYHPSWGETTAVMEWDMVCDKVWRKPLIISLCMCGVLVGAAVSGALSDRFGRRPILLWGTLLQFTSTFANGFNGDSILFTLTLFLAGAATPLKFVTAFVLVTEIVDSSKRALVGSLQNGGFTLGYMILPACAYFITDWHWLMRFMGIFGVLFIPYYWWIPESPRWLIMMGKENEARDLILKIAKKNGKELREEDLFLVLTNLQQLNLSNHLKYSSKELNEVKMEEDETEKEQFTYLDLFRHPSIRLRTLVMFVVWNTTSMTYFCISLGTSNLGGNKFVNCFVAAAVEIPACVSTYLIMERFGRRTILFSYLIVGGIACRATPFFLHLSESAMIASSMVSKFTITGVFIIIFIMCCEMFPTKMRNMSVGASSTLARVGAITAPYLIYAGESVSLYVPYLIMGGCAILSGLLTLCLPETSQSSLPETLEDSVKLDRYKLRACRDRSSGETSSFELEETEKSPKA